MCLDGIERPLVESGGSRAVSRGPEPDILGPACGVVNPPETVCRLLLNVLRGDEFGDNADSDLTGRFGADLDADRGPHRVELLL